MSSNLIQAKYVSDQVNMRECRVKCISSICVCWLSPGLTRCYLLSSNLIQAKYVADQVNMRECRVKLYWFHFCVWLNKVRNARLPRKIQRL